MRDPRLVTRLQGKYITVIYLVLLTSNPSITMLGDLGELILYSSQYRLEARQFLGFRNMSGC